MKKLFIPLLVARALFTHPTDASLGHPLFAARKEGNGQADKY
jgi:hypothetical protein